MHDHLPYRVLPPSLLASFISPLPLPPPPSPVFSCPCVPCALVCPCSVCPPPPSAARKPLMRVWHRRVQGGVDPKSGDGRVCEGLVWSGARMGTVDGAVQVGGLAKDADVRPGSAPTSPAPLIPSHHVLNFPPPPPPPPSPFVCHAVGVSATFASLVPDNQCVPCFPSSSNPPPFPCFPCATALAGSPILRVAHHYHL